RREKASNWLGLGWAYGACSAVEFRRKLKPVGQWCDSSPNFSMVPLNGDENFGEAVAGSVREGRLSRLEDCTIGDSRAGRDWTSICNHACPIHESQPEQNLSFCASIQGPDPWDHSTIGQSARGQWPCWRDRRGIDRALRLCSRGRGRRGRIECALLQDVHRGVEQAGRVVAAVWGQDGGAGVDRGVLDSAGSEVG